MCVSRPGHLCVLLLGQLLPWLGEMELRSDPAPTAASLPTGDQWLVSPPRGGPGQDQAPEGGHEEAEAEHRCVLPRERPQGCWHGLEEESLLCLSLCVEQPQPHCPLCPHGHWDPKSLWGGDPAWFSRPCSALQPRFWGSVGTPTLQPHLSLLFGCLLMLPPAS